MLEPADAGSALAAKKAQPENFNLFDLLNAARGN
jgi:hypothetical protein